MEEAKSRNLKRVEHQRVKLQLVRPGLAAAATPSGCTAIIYETIAGAATAAGEKAAGGKAKESRAT